MPTLKDDIKRVLANLHRKTNQEYIELKEIYEEVEKIRKKPISLFSKFFIATLP